MTAGRQTLPLEARPRVYQAVIAAIERRIDAEGLSAGDRLPSESELAESLQVSTRAIREAYATLRTLGVVEIKHGKGIFLAENSFEYFLESLATSLKFTFSDTGTLLLELTDVRLLVEAGLVSVFTRGCSERDIAALDEIVERMAVHYRDGTIEQFNEADFSFHTYIVNRSGNRIVRSLYFHLQNLLHQSIEVTQLYGGSERQCLADHQGILDAIRKRDSEGAKTRMEEHLGRTRKTVAALYGPA